MFVWFGETVSFNPEAFEAEIERKQESTIRSELEFLQLHKNVVHHLLMLLESTNVKIVLLHEFQFVFTNQQEDCVVSVFLSTN